MKKKTIEEIEELYSDKIVDIKDLVGDQGPSKLFYTLIDKLGFLLDENPELVLSKRGVEVRRIVNKIIKSCGDWFLSSSQKIEDREFLRNRNNNRIDFGINLPDEPVIWAPNHGFRDDALATVLAIPRNGYFLFGSLPQFYNTTDGVTAWLNGSIMVNRNMPSSKKASIEKCKYAVDLGADLIIFPEGVWNKSPNKLVLDLWPGVYRIAKEKNIKIVPIIHYKRELHSLDKGDVIHTVIDDPIDVSGMSEEEALRKLRDIYATWLIIMMERYGKSTREEEVKGFDNSTDKWDDLLEKRISTADRYYFDLETRCQYYDKKQDELISTWEDIANADNVNPYNARLIEDAKEEVKVLKRCDFQRRY